MIQEDYVSFETAKLLKEKGFNEIKCNTCYKWNGNFCNNRRSMSGIDNEICYQAPTLQMAMKWLRKIHNIDVIINVSSKDESVDKRKYTYAIVSKLFIGTDNVKRIYEEACEAAIKYCLENLI